MAEDGLLVNFAVPDLFTSGPTKFKGGSWKERMRLQKNAKNRVNGTSGEQKPAGRDAAYQRAVRDRSQTQAHDLENGRPVKRRRENGEFVPANANGNAARTRDHAHDHAKKPTRQREVISSLFSYNPKPQALEDTSILENEDAIPAKPSNAPLPDGIDTFTSLGLSTILAAHLLTKLNLKNPTAIQKASISQLVKEDSDAFIQSETGSGKTLAYLLPIVQRIMATSEQSKADIESAVHRDSGLFAIILAPTRELCKQILVVLERLLSCANYVVAGSVMGGEKKKSEKARLRKGLNILVATPGRLVDHLDNTQALDVSYVRYLVLDEGDRLMDLGFEEDITKIVKSLDSKKRKSTAPGLPERRITVLCSATLKMNVQKLGDISLKDAVLIKGDSSDGTEVEPAGHSDIDSAFLAPAQLKQGYIVVATKLRLVTLTALLRKTFARKGSVMKAIVFVSCADSVEFHHKTFSRGEKDEGQSKQTKSTSDDQPAADLMSDTSKRSPSDTLQLQDSVSLAPCISSPSNPITTYKLHGSLPQSNRTAIVKSFTNTTEPSLLIATDVASRGLDLPNLDLVIEYDPAFNTDDHLHRIGRTARLGRDGRAIIFLLPGKEEGYVDVLKKSYKVSAVTERNVTSQTAEDVLKKGFTPTSGVVTNGSKDWEAKATDFQLDVERWVLSDAKYKELAKKAFQSHVRAYATHVVDERKWFDIKELHLGHLAKAFGLRDPPGRVNVQGMRNGNTGGNSNGRKRRVVDQNSDRGEAALTQVKSAKGKGAEIDELGHADDHAKKMRDVVRNRKRMMGAGADEFNLA